MMLATGHFATARRRGIVLLVVISLLTLFAIVGLTFVLYAQAKAEAARIYREYQIQSKVQFPDTPPQLLFEEWLRQFIYDKPDDPSGVVSALHGHSLARLMYSYNPDRPNKRAFDGTGRLHTDANSYMNPYKIDDYLLVNYMWFRSDGFLRYPERLGSRKDPSQLPLPPFLGGFNPPCTYPDLNNMFLAAVSADGRVLMPSFHRPWLFGGDDPNTNPNWTNPEGKYLTLRPREFDQRLDPNVRCAFPYPTNGGDVKNLLGAPGGNDSYFHDIGSPVKTLPDGRKYKPLYAALVVDLDNRINLNVIGNIRGLEALGRPISTVPSGDWHRSNTGWGPWEVNLQYVLNAKQASGAYEWPNLFLGNPQTPPANGRYGNDQEPSIAGTSAQSGKIPHFYGQVDYDGCNEQNNFVPTAQITLPAGPSAFPTYPQGYGNGFAENKNHPLRYDYFQPRYYEPSLKTFADDNSLDVSNTVALLRDGSIFSEVAASDLGKQLPLNFNPNDPNSARRRRLTTTISAALNIGGVTAWNHSLAVYGYGYAGTDNRDFAPSGQPIPFPQFGTNPGGEFDTDWRSNDDLRRIDLDRFLPPYPHMGQGTDEAGYKAVPLVGPTDRFDVDKATNGPIYRQYVAAEVARRQLADDIYRRLLQVTGVGPVANRKNPTADELMPRRWLAQLAANIVDYIDEDDISTPFDFYTAYDASGDPNNPDPTFDIFEVSDNKPELLKYWVFGTEMPRVLLNEVLTEFEEVKGSGKAHLVDVKVWAELFNPLMPKAQLPKNPDGTFKVDAQDGDPVPFWIGTPGGPGYSPYRLVVANTASVAQPLLIRLKSNDNILGTPELLRTTTADSDFAAASVRTVGNPTPTEPMSIAPQQYFLLGPPGPDARNTIQPQRVPGGTPWLQSTNLKYTVDVDKDDKWNPGKDDRAFGATVLLRRLANPHLPYDPKTNPFVTMDYLERIPLNDATLPTTVYASRGKLQPYAADYSQIANEVPVPGSNTKHTLGQLNDPLAPKFDWLVHLDRQLVNPMELLQVSGFHPHQLTHQFITGTAPNQRFTQRVPWFDQSRRLYRIFELLETHDRAHGVPVYNRQPGLININTIWDPETFLALCDPQISNNFTPDQLYKPLGPPMDANHDDPANPKTIYWRMIFQRTPGMLASAGPSPSDRPFLGLATGVTAPNDRQYPLGIGIINTFLRAADGSSDALTPRLFEPWKIDSTGKIVDLDPTMHPYLKEQLLTKLFNNVTTRSNVFAVWLTVGFFEVTDANSVPPKLGAELNAAEGQNVRHHMFAIVDRSALTVRERPAAQYITVSTESVGSSGPSTLHYNPTTAPFIQAGQVLTVDLAKANEETIVVSAVGFDAKGPTFTATFNKMHAAGFEIMRCDPGNPGPQPQFVPQDNSAVVPYSKIID